MRTPGHAVINLAVLGAAAPDATLAVVAGAVAPDLPIAALYLWQRSRGAPAAEIWRVHYPKPRWSNVIHGMHSIPLALAGLAVCWALGATAGALFFASAALHSLADLPVHARDAHRHFLPFSHWRWISPWSYWDVARHARPVTIAEWLLVAAGSAVILATSSSPWTLPVLIAVQLGYAVSLARLYLAPEPAA